MLTKEIKAKIVKEAKRHERLDAFVAGAYEQKNGVTKHCSIGCVRFALGMNATIGEHGKLVDPTGVPEFILILSDSIFEGLPPSHRGKWTRELWSALPVGKSLDHVADAFSAWCMLDKKHGLAHIGLNPEIKAAAKAIGELFLRRSTGDKPTKAEWDAAWKQADAAWQQADAAMQQADAAWRQADAARAKFWIAASKELTRSSRSSERYGAVRDKRDIPAPRR